jgi:hypothetical protein
MWAVLAELATSPAAIAVLAMRLALFAVRPPFFPSPARAES